MHGTCGDGATLDARWPANVGREIDLLSLGPPPNVGRENAAVVIESPNGLWQQTENVTVGLDLEIPTPPPGDEVAAIIGILGWGVGGARHETEFDWRAGAQLSVPCSRVDVRAFFEPPNIGEALIDRVRIRASLSYGTRPTRSLVTRTSPRAIIAPAGEVIFPIARMAYAVNVAFSSLGAYVAATTFRARAGVTVTSPILLELNGLDLRAALLGEGVHLPGGTRSISIANAAGGGILGRAIWALAI
jgi:hypothetical protein